MNDNPLKLYHAANSFFADLDAGLQRFRSWRASISQSPISPRDGKHLDTVEASMWNMTFTMAIYRHAATTIQHDLPAMFRGKFNWLATRTIADSDPANVAKHR